MIGEEGDFYLGTTGMSSHMFWFDFVFFWIYIAIGGFSR
jgi:hypothetical protein